MLGQHPQKDIYLVLDTACVPWHDVAMSKPRQPPSEEVLRNRIRKAVRHFVFVLAGKSLYSAVRQQVLDRHMRNLGSEVSFTERKNFAEAFFDRVKSVMDEMLERGELIEVDQNQRDVDQCQRRNHGKGNHKVLRLAEQTVGTSAERLRATLAVKALKWADGAPDVALRLDRTLRLVALAHRPWTTEDGSLVLGDRPDVKGAVMLPSQVRVEGLSVQVTSGFLFLVGHDGRISLRATPNMPESVLEDAPLGSDRDFRMNLSSYADIPVDGAMFSVAPRVKAGLNAHVSSLIVLHPWGILTAAGRPEDSENMANDALMLGRFLKRTRHSTHAELAGYLVRRLLPDESWAAALRLPSCTMEQWNELHGEDATATRNRRQFAHSCPGLLPMLVAPRSAHPLTNGLRAIVDTGKPVLPFLVEHTGLTRAVVRALLSASWQRVTTPKSMRGRVEGLDHAETRRVGLELAGFLNDDGLGRLAFLDMVCTPPIEGGKAEHPMRRFLAALPPEWLPADATSWACVRIGCTEALNMERLGYIACAQHEMLTLTRRHLSGRQSVRRGWKATMQQLRGMQRPGDVTDARRWLVQVLRAMTGQLPEGGGNAFFAAIEQDNRRLRGERGPLPVATLVVHRLVGLGSKDRRVADGFSRAWHDAQGEMETRLREVPRVVPAEGATPPPLPTSWASPTPWEVYDLAGGCVTWLSDQAALDAESDEMVHCVRGYAVTCLTNGSRIVSVVGAQGGRSTCEFQPFEGGFQVVQHRGIKNVEPLQDCVRVIDALKGVLAKLPPEVAEGIAGDAAENRRNHPGGMAGHGNNYDFDLNFPGVPEAVLDVMRPLFLPRYRRITPAQVRDMMDEACEAFRLAHPRDAEVEDVPVPERPLRYRPQVAHAA